MPGRSRFLGLLFHCVFGGLVAGGVSEDKEDMMEELLREAVKVGIDTGDIVSAVRWYQILAIIKESLTAIFVFTMFTAWGWMVWKIVQKVRKWDS